jgi:general secretion pathway protein G
MPDPKKLSGFTLIELMIAITIVAIITATGVVVYSTAQKTARIEKRAQDLKSIQSGLELYKQATGGYPKQIEWACISASLTALVPDYIPSLPADPLDNGNPAGPNCYQHRSGPVLAIGTALQYKIRTNPRVSSSGEMDSTAFSQRQELIDTARDGLINCVVDSGPYTGWSLYNGSDICSDPVDEIVTTQ